MSETCDIIQNWLKEEFPVTTWETRGEQVTGTIGGLTLELRIEPKELTVGIWVKMPFKKASKVREVHLSSPTSIEDLQEVVKHTIKITTKPTWIP
jgi:hypothetical protein